MKTPNEAIAKQIVESATGRQVIQLHRFTTGLCHYVYDVFFENGEQIVIRIASEESIGELEGGIY